MPKLENRAISLGDVLRTQGQVIYALMLRDVKTRYFGNGLGFLFSSVAWPLVHVLVLLAVYTTLGRTAPFGSSTILFSATGLVPFMTFSYMSRWIIAGAGVEPAPHRLSRRQNYRCPHGPRFP
jgi:capsular polysaccharide transport system permease protein